MPTPKATLIALWERALAEEIGIAVKVPDKKLFINELYEARKASSNLALEELMIAQPANGEVWIIKRTTKVD